MTNTVDLETLSKTDRRPGFLATWLLALALWLVSQVAQSFVFTASEPRPERAGLRGGVPSGTMVGDVITHVDGRPVESIEELADAFEQIGIGDKAELTILRQGRELTIVLDVVDVS